MTSAAYDVVYDSLKKAIVDGKYQIGSILPSEPELESIYRVSRTTIRRATGMLTQEGLIKPLRGIGTVVLDYHITQNLNKITSITEGLKEKGYIVSLKEFTIRVEKPKANIASILELQEGQEIVHVERILCADGKPIAVLENFISHDLVAGFENYKKDKISFYRYLAEHYFIHFDMSQDSITAMNADRALADKLDVPVGFALLTIHRKCIGQGKCLCYDISHICSDVYSFGVTLMGS